MKIYTEDKTFYLVKRNGETFTSPKKEVLIVNAFDKITGVKYFTINNLYKWSDKKILRIEDIKNKDGIPYTKYTFKYLLETLERNVAAKNEVTHKYYKEWIDCGNKGSKEEFLEAITVKGDPGEPGKDGDPGPKGDPGEVHRKEGKFTGQFDLSKGDKVYYDDYNEGETVSLSISEKTKLGSIATVRIKGDLLGTIPSNWIIRGDSIGREENNINEITIWYINSEDVRFYNHLIIVARPFIIQIDTRIDEGITDDNQFTITTDSRYDYNFKVETDNQVFENVTEDLLITYDEPGIYDVKIYGEYPKPNFDSYEGGEGRKIINIKQWGDIVWKDFSYSFRWCHHITGEELIDAPNLTQVEETSGMFYLSSFNKPVHHWDVSNVIYMDYMFARSSFKQDVSDWDVSNVETLFNFLSLFYEEPDYDYPYIDEVFNKWSQLDLKPNVTLSITGTYTSEGQDGKEILENEFGWTIRKAELG